MQNKIRRNAFLSIDFFRSSRAALAVLSAGASLVTASAASASQGPGIAPGTASAVTQLGMAIVVYGASASVIAAGLIGAMRRR